MKRNKLIQRRAVVALCCLLLLNIAVPGLVYARQVWSPFDHTIVALRDQYRFGGIWTQQGINWFQANQQWLVTLQRHRYWWESETRAPESHIQRMAGPDPTTTPFFYSSVVWNSITSSGIPEHRLEADEEEVSHQLNDLQKRVAGTSVEELRRLRDEKGIDYQFTISDAKTRLEQMQTIFPVDNPTANLRVYAIGLEGNAADVYRLWQNPQVDVVDLVPNLRAWHDLDFAAPRPDRSPFLPQWIVSEKKAAM